MEAFSKGSSLELPQAAILHYIKFLVQILSEMVSSLKYFVEQSTSVEMYFEFLLVKFKQRLHLVLSVCVKTF